MRVWVSGDEEFTETRIYRMEREGHVSLREITKHALKKTDNLLAEGVLPYDFSKATEFRMGYLSGFYAEKRDIERKELEEEIHREVENCTRDLLEDTIHGYNGVHILSDHIRPIREQWKYTLLPVWTVTYKGMNGKMYYYSMNGQNGKTYGELPVDRKSISVWCVVWRYSTGDHAVAWLLYILILGEENENDKKKRAVAALAGRNRSMSYAQRGCGSFCTGSRASGI